MRARVSRICSQLPRSLGQRRGVTARQRSPSRSAITKRNV
ncbi:Uncharacterised protein [Bordetella pertussis]|nr:Uncharacterised protein [Bordetella pertussis]CFW43950.1 Uncharacterised protein [Bordetella pertussis]